jgi:hypothetical protein
MARFELDERAARYAIRDSFGEDVVAISCRRNRRSFTATIVYRGGWRCRAYGDTRYEAIEACFKASDLAAT